MASIFKRGARQLEARIRELDELIQHATDPVASKALQRKRARAAARLRQKPYHMSFRDRRGKRVTENSGTADMAEAERIARKREADEALLRSRVETLANRSIQAAAQCPISDHFDAYQAKLNVAGRTRQHVGETIGTIREAFSECATISDITAEVASAHASTLIENKRSARTVQKHLTALKGFTRWLVSTDKLDRDPLASISKPNPKTDRRHERRIMLREEWEHLHGAILNEREERYGMPAAERVLLYATAIETGLRSNELRSVRRGMLFLEDEPPFITCEAGSTKNRKLAKQYITDELAAELRAHIRQKHTKAPVFGMPHPTDMARMLREDLQAARNAWLKPDVPLDPQEAAQRAESDFLSYKNHDGRALDFHALRHTCGAWYVLAGEHAKTVQTIMRHSTITLTLDTYGHLLPGQQQDAARRFQGTLPGADEALQATGTDCARPESETARLKSGRNLSARSKPTVADCSDPVPTQSKAGDSEGRPKPLRLHHFDGTGGDVAGRVGNSEKWGRRDSNPQPTDYESETDSAFLADSEGMAPDSDANPSAPSKAGRELLLAVHHALSVDSLVADQLRQVVEAWPYLDPDQRSRILRFIDRQR